MERVIELIRIVRSSNIGRQDRARLLATLSDIAGIWRQTGSLAAYEVIVSALDSNDDDIRRWAEETLNRHSPRPGSRQASRKEVSHWGNLGDRRSRQHEE